MAFPTMLEDAEDLWKDLHPNEMVPSEDDLMCWYLDIIERNGEADYESIS